MSVLSHTADCRFHVFVQLEAFLTQRVNEMGEEGDVVAMSQFQLAPSVIQGQSREHIREMLSEVQDLLGRLTSLRMQHLFMIQASPRYAAICLILTVSVMLSMHTIRCNLSNDPDIWHGHKGTEDENEPLLCLHVTCCRYVERVTEVLRQKLKQADILVLKGATMVEKRQEALEEQSRLEPRVDLLAGCTRELQKLVLDYYFNLFLFTGWEICQLSEKRRLSSIFLFFPPLTVNVSFRFYEHLQLQIKGIHVVHRAHN